MEREIDNSPGKQQSIEGYRLSPPQARLWRLSRGVPGAGLNAQCVLRVAGPCEIPLLRSAVERIIQRHETLRTSYRLLPGMQTPIQEIRTEGLLAWEALDWRELAAAGRRAALTERLERDRRECGGFAESDAAVRAFTALIDAHELLLVVSLTPMTGDARTLINLSEMIGEAYEEVLGRAPKACVDDIVQYVQFSEWQNELMEEQGGAGREFWEQAAKRQTGAVALPLERERRGEQRSAIEWSEIELAARVQKEIRTLGQEEGVSEETILLACWQALLARLSATKDVAVRVSLHGRSYEEMQPALGLYARWPLVVGDYNPEFQYLEALRQLNERLQSAYEWQEYYPGEQNENEGAHESIGFEYQEWPDLRKHGNLSFSLDDLQCSTDVFKVRLSVARSGERLRVRFYYDAGRFSAAAISALAERFEATVRSATSNPRLPIECLETLGEQERRALYSQAGRQRREYPAQSPLELFEQWASGTPDATAIECGDQALSYGELDRRAESIGRRLRRLGMNPGERVALLLERSVETAACVLGVWKAGGAYIPLDGQQPELRLRAILKGAGAGALLSSRRMMEGLSKEVWEGPLLLMEQQEKGEESLAVDRASAGGESLCYVIYTSGTSGEPKGVMARESSASNLIWALEEDVYAELSVDRVSVNAPLYFDASVKQLLQLCRGRTLVMIPEEIRADAAWMVKYLREKRVELFDSTPSQLRALLEAGLETDSGPQAGLIGGEAIDEALWSRLGASGTKYFNVYGPTECTVDATCERVSETRPSLGRALGNMEVYTLEGPGKAVGSGVKGEICIGGAGVSHGYEGDARKTAEKFTPDWLSGRSGARLYRTGDEGRVNEEGRVEYLGRRDGQVKLRGRRIELGEIEAALMSCAGVSQAAVVVLEREGGDARLAAYVTGKEIEEEGLRRHVRERLPEYMVPSWIVLLEKTPLTPNGKIDRKALPDPELMQANSQRERLAPRDAVERTLHDIWGEVLKLKMLGVDENFFELGGHSLLATQVVSRIREAFTIEIPLRSLFEASTIEQQAAAIEKLRQNGAGIQAPAIGRASRGQYRASGEV